MGPPPSVGPIPMLPPTQEANGVAVQDVLPPIQEEDTVAVQDGLHALQLQDKEDLMLLQDKECDTSGVSLTKAKKLT